MLKGLLLSGLVLVLAVLGGLYYDHATSFSGSIPVLANDWWGNGSPRKDDTTIKPFKVDFSKELLDDLSHRLNRTRPFHPPLEGIGFEYGFNSKFLQTVLDFWKTKYSWKDRQAFLNSLPQFTTEVQGLNIHFIHVKPANTAGLKVVPLLLVHGWPGSVREFYDIIPLLVTPRPGQDFVFEVVAPSLPGYGFSQAAVRPGLGGPQMAVVFHSLMHRLGHKKFYIQGGDWGAIIGTFVSQLYPQSVMGLHTNMASVLPTPGLMLRLMICSLFPSLVGNEAEQKFVYPMLDRWAFLLEEMGYLHLQATKPDTVGVALRDSPLGLAAYILEKFSTWTNPSWKSLPDGGLLKKYKLENLLDNIMIYWLTGSATSSMRLYSEQLNKRHNALGFEKAPVIVPTAIARFPYEISNQPRSILEMKFQNLVQLSDFATGGHFAAFEEPQLLADDFWMFVDKVQHAKPKSS